MQHFLTSTLFFFIGTDRSLDYVSVADLVSDSLSNNPAEYQLPTVEINGLDTGTYAFSGAIRGAVYRCAGFFAYIDSCNEAVTNKISISVGTNYPVCDNMLSTTSLATLNTDKEVISVAGINLTQSFSGRPYVRIRTAASGAGLTVHKTRFILELSYLKPL